MKITSLIFILLLSLFVHDKLQGQWVAVGDSLFSHKRAEDHSLHVDDSGTLYACYSSPPPNPKATVMKFNGTNWVDLGNQFNVLNGTRPPAFTLDNNGVPFILHTKDQDEYQTLEKYDGKKWLSVASVPNIANTHWRNALAFSTDNIPYVVYKDDKNDSKKFRVQKYNGKEWEIIGDAIGIEGNMAYYGLYFASDNVPHLIYSEIDENQYLHKLCVVKYAGGRWQYVGERGFITQAKTNIKATFDSSGNMYISFPEGELRSRASVMKFDGSS